MTNLEENTTEPWVNADGKEFELKDMATRHIANCYDFVTRKYNESGKTEHLIWVRRFEDELSRRDGYKIADLAKATQQLLDIFCEGDIHHYEDGHSFAEKTQDMIDYFGGSQ
ncbi:hypothetical protein OAF54_03190 [bacterium]|nr:hypothetical protein [bacterium]